MLRRKGMQLGLRGALVGGGPRWWALTVLVPLLCGAVPILLVNSVLRDVKGDVATWQSQIAQLTDKVRASCRVVLFGTPSQEGAHGELALPAL